MMKLVVVLIGLVLVNDAVNSVPMVNTEVPEGPVIEGAEEMSVGTEEVPEGTEENTAINVDEKGVKPSDRYMEEVKEYFQQQIFEKSLNRETRQITSTPNILCFKVVTISHGDTIALQTFVRAHWLSCSGDICWKNPCPGMYMTGNDWSNCWGEVFRIYRASGPGVVRVGDLVGLYYPHEAGRWMGCAGHSCAKNTCPGHPTTAYGFASSEIWYRCWGEVFKIYARGKTSGAAINSNDDIVLYYLQGELWVSQGYSEATTKRPCLGTSRPPTSSVYDGCGLEVFKIWKR